MPRPIGYRTAAACLVAAGLITSLGCEPRPQGRLHRVPPPPRASAQGGGYDQGGPAAGADSIQPQPMDHGSSDAAANQPGRMTLGQPGYQSPGAAAGSGAMSRTYVVRKHDTLWSIAQRVYGNGQRWKDIARANPSLNPSKLPVGKSIVLPPK